MGVLVEPAGNRHRRLRSGPTARAESPHKWLIQRQILLEDPALAAIVAAKSAQFPPGFHAPTKYTQIESLREVALPSTFGIMDLFAGPGGLGEGFTSFAQDEHSPYRIGISVEKEKSAHRTLTVRAFLRACQARHGSFPEQYIEFHAGLIPEPDWSTVDADAWRVATGEAQCIELGTDDATSALDLAIKQLQNSFDDTILIGGPPCQAYSLVARARTNGIPIDVREQDNRHFLFRDYIRILDKLRPAAFVMENVKGMLSSTLSSRYVFELIMEGLSSLGNGHGHVYEIRAINVEDGKARLKEAKKKSDFVVRAEDFGVPQRRHRVIIVGIRADIASDASTAWIRLPSELRTVEEAIGKMPKLRSGLSRGQDSVEAWKETVVGAANSLASLHSGQDNASLRNVFSALARDLSNEGDLPRKSSTLQPGYGKIDDEFFRWIERPAMHALAQHETRGHMPSDLRRYLFAAAFGRTRGFSPKAADFPSALSPDHMNWYTGMFNDRFRVQLANQAATTVTSHISKDGHYFIHPDPYQCRSLTVREAARLQTFPDDYLFLGTRTQQYVQVGNAVPPLLARQIAELVFQSIQGKSG